MEVTFDMLSYSFGRKGLMVKCVESVREARAGFCKYSE